ncbi:hypothetical protein B0H14DRAFT_3512346 [Mycena olivaceomarginata]|nr:hypothetical protein B0H14DRAFT_3512346 [Mycena olivaceomarginata]
MSIFGRALPGDCARDGWDAGHRNLEQPASKRNAPRFHLLQPEAMVPRWTDATPANVLSRRDYMAERTCIYELKSDSRKDAGLAPRSGRHAKSHERPEVKTFLKEYRRVQLSKRRPGRIYDERNIANFREGFKHLEGHLSKWAVRTSNARIRYMQHGAGDAVAEESDDESDDSDGEQDNTMTAGDIAQK